MSVIAFNVMKFIGIAVEFYIILINWLLISNVTSIMEMSISFDIR